MANELPVAFVRLLEDICAGRPPDEIIFAFGLVLGQVIKICALEEDHEEVIEACVKAIRVGLRAEYEH
jgi:hypothetical protein